MSSGLNFFLAIMLNHSLKINGTVHIHCSTEHPGVCINTMHVGPSNCRQHHGVSIDINTTCPIACTCCVGYLASSVWTGDTFHLKHTHRIQSVAIM